jgi:pimeloyl-ACP methyl ester carboxylesterase
LVDNGPKRAFGEDGRVHDVSVIDGGVHYARNGDVRLAYRVLGDADTTVVWVPGWVSNVELLGDPDIPFTSFFEQLAHRTRFIAWDKRGTGLSDPVTRVPPLDERMDDLHAVLDAARADCPVLWGVSEGGPMSILFAATYPERVRSLILYGTLPGSLPSHPTTHGVSLRMWPLRLVVQSKAIGVKAHWLTSSSVRSPTCRASVRCMAGSSALQPVR